MPELALVSTVSGVALLNGLNVLSNINLGFPVTASVISPDGKEAILGGQDGKVHIYSINGDSFTEEAVLEKHRGAITAIWYSPDLCMFASGDANREAVVWDRSSREDALSERLASQSPPLTGEGDSSTSDVDHTKLFLDIEGVNKKKKVYGLGSAATAYVDTAGSKVIANSSSSMSQQNEEEVDRLVQQNNQMSDKVAELEAQVVEQNKHLAESEKRMSEKMNELAEHNKQMAEQMAELMKKMIPTPAPAP